MSGVGPADSGFASEASSAGPVTDASAGIANAPTRDSGTASDVGARFARATASGGDGATEEAIADGASRRQSLDAIGIHPNIA